jgi:hypothetical protein
MIMGVVMPDNNFLSYLHPFTAVPMASMDGSTDYVPFESWRVWVTGVPTWFLLGIFLLWKSAVVLDNERRGGTGLKRPAKKTQLVEETDA